MADEPNTSPAASMTARELWDKLEAERAQHLAATRALERERDKLLLAKHTGDAEAVQRSGAIRAELDERASAMRELVQLQAGLEPRLRLERAAGVRALREHEAEQLERVLDAAAVAVARLDAGVAQIAEAMKVARPLVDHARIMAGRLISTNNSGDFNQAALSTMLAIHTSALRPLSEQLEDRLRALHVFDVLPGSYQAAPTLAEGFALARQQIRVRVQDRIQLGQRQAEVEAAEMEAEMAALLPPAEIEAV